MRVFGYQQNSEDLLQLEEISIECSIEELEKLIEFLNEVKTKHNAVKNQTDMCHSHYRDWKSDWNNKEPDIIMVTKFEQKNINLEK